MDEMIRKSRDYGRARLLTQFPDLAWRIAHKKQERRRAPLMEIAR